MKRLSWQVVWGIIFISLSLITYVIHFLIFRDMHHIFLYLVGDIAFVFFQVFMVTLVIDRLLKEKERQDKLKKLNMVIGAFFSEVGTALLRQLSGCDIESKKIAQELLIKADWDEQKFNQAHQVLKKTVCHPDSKKCDLNELRAFLCQKREFLLRLLENPNLLEHDSFTSLLWAVFHLTEELENRRSVFNLPENDYKHLSGDINRVYSILVSEWLDYMKHLKENYPYLFSLAMRTNPFDAEACVEIK